MDQERWAEVDRIFHEALALPLRARAAFLDTMCEADEALRQQVEALLTADATGSPLLSATPGTLAAHLLDEEATLDDPDLIDTQVGVYRIVEVLGRGGMGAVYLAERADGQFEQQVAIKVVKRGMDTEEILRRFRHERQILAALKHPNIARLYDGGVTGDDRPYLVMEYIEGQPIDRYCDAHHLTVDARLRLFQKVCEAVHYAHRNLVVHRDLKPGNILVTEEGEVKLLDFGIAKLLTSEPASGMAWVTQVGDRVMTPAYAAPEQILDAPVTTATDIFALGVVLYELLTGRRPFGNRGATGATEPERPSTVVTKPALRRGDDGATETVPPEQASAARNMSPDRLGRRLRGDLDVITLKALREEPDRRYASAEAFVEDIRCHLAGLPVEARPDTVGYRIRKFIHRHRVGAVATAAMLVLTLAFATFYVNRITQERNRALHESNKAEAVATFLKGLFEAADPFSPTPERLDTLRVVALLERGERQIQRELVDQPVVQGQMMTVIGGIYRRLALHDRARPLLEQGLALVQQDISRSKDEVTVAESLHELGLLLFAVGEVDSSEVLLQRAEAIYQQGEHVNAQQEMLVRSSLAEIHNYRGEYDDAETFLRELLDQNNASLLDDSQRAHYLTRLAVVLYNRDATDEAMEPAREAVRLLRRAYHRDHPQVAKAQLTLALLLTDQGHYNEAEQRYREALAMQRRIFSGDHPDISLMLHDLAEVLDYQERYADAEALYREALAMDRRIFGDHHIRIAQQLYGLANNLTLQQKCGIAEPLWWETLAITRETLPPGHEYIAIAAGMLGTCLVDLQRYNEAEPFLLESYEILRARPPNPFIDLGDVAQQLQTLYAIQGKPEQAAQWAQRLDSSD